MSQLLTTDVASAAPAPGVPPWYVRALQALPLGVAWLEGDRFVWVNDEFCRLVGWPREELLNRLGFDLLHPDDLERVRARHQARKRGERPPTTYEVDFSTREGIRTRLEMSPRVLPGGETLLLLRGLGERLRDQALLGALGQLAASVQRATTVEAAARAAVEGLWALGMHAGVMRVDGGTVEQLAVAMRDEVRDLMEEIGGVAVEALRVRLDGLPQADRAVGEARPIFVDDALEGLKALARVRGRTFTDAHAQRARAIGVDQLVHIPLSVSGEHWGLLTVMGSGLRSNDAAALALFGAQLGSAIEAAETIENLEKHNRRLEAVHRLTLQGAQKGLRPLAEALLTELAHGTRSQFATLYLVSRKDETLVLTQSVGAPRWLCERFEVLPLNEHLALWPDRLQNAHRIDWSRLEAPTREALERSGMHAAMVVPLWADGELIGVGYLGRTEGPAYLDAEVRDVEMLVALVALQLERARLFEDVQASYEKLSHAQAQLVRRERLAALGELSALVAHEVRNPLGAIVNSVASLRRLVTEEGDAKLLLNIVEEESDRLNRMVSDLLDFARPSQPQIRELPLETLVLGAVESSVRATPANAQVKVDTSVCPAAPVVKVDAQMFRQAVVNLVTNAFQVSKPGEVVTVRAFADTLRGAPCVAVTVSDEGPGVPADLAERIFQPFFTTRAMGTGLGLAVVKRIAETHGAEVGVGSAPGGGAVFTLRFPL